MANDRDCNLDQSAAVSFRGPELSGTAGQTLDRIARLAGDLESLGRRQLPEDRGIRIQRDRRNASVARLLSVVPLDCQTPGPFYTRLHSQRLHRFLPGVTCSCNRTAAFGRTRLPKRAGPTRCLVPIHISHQLRSSHRLHLDPVSDAGIELRLRSPGATLVPARAVWRAYSHDARAL